MEGLVFDIQRGSISNGPGIRTTIFLKGCPLKCLWCHNPESKSHKFQAKPKVGKTSEELGSELRTKSGISTLWVNQNYEIEGAEPKGLSCVENSLIGRCMTVDEVLAIVLKDKHYFQDGLGGVTISGGEPLAQPVFTLSVLQESKKVGIHTCLDTSGYVSQKHLLSTLPYTDLYLYDYKITSPKKHQQFTGKSNELILQNLAVIAKAGANIRLRCPLIPNINLAEEHFEGIISLMRYLPIREVELLPYQHYWLGKYPELTGNSPLSDTDSLIPDVLEQWLQRLKAKGISIV